jgi:hypothetical protein
MPDHHDPLKRGHETFALPIGPVLVATAAILAIAIISFVSMWGMLLGMEKANTYLAADPPPMTAVRKPYTGLLIQSDPPAELAQVRLETQQTLSSYGWVDKDAGVVHLPIDTAKSLALKRGFPVRK